MQTDLQAPTVAPTATDFAELSRLVRAEGLLARRRGYYVVKIGVTVSSFAASVATAVIVGNTWWNLLVAVGLAVALVQLGFIGHDAGHRQIASRRRVNDAIGLVHANLLTGFSFGWWLTKHSRHHAHANQLDRDPDIGSRVLTYTPAQTEERGRFGRWFAHAQAVLIVPLLFLEAFNIHYASVVSIIRRHDRVALLETVLLVVHGGAFFVAPFFLLSPVRAVAFVAVTQTLFGFYLGVSFVTNHIGMPTLAGPDELGFLRRQVLTSRNLSGRLFTGFVFGGLDTQIEHHLFPTMPRANLRRARQLVRPFCAEHAIDYAEQNPWQAYRDVYRYLRQAGNPTVVPVVG